MRRKKLLHSLTASIEWRILAFLITGLFLWVTVGSFWKAAQTAFILQLILLTGHTAWLYYRSGYVPLEQV
jgi:hypothetical protein